MASKEGESSGSSTDSIELAVLASHESRSMATQPEGDFETLFISTDFSSSGNSEITNRTESIQDPLMFESQSTESSNLGTQAEDPNICRQIFPTESLTQNYSDTSSLTIHAPNTTQVCSSGILNPEPCTSGIIHQIASDGTETIKSETSDSTSNTERVSATESDSTDCTINTESLTQYVRGVETQDDSQEIYPSTMSQSSEGLKRSDRRPEQRYEIASEDCSSSLDPTYDPAVLEIPPLTRQDAITPSTSSKRDLESTEEDNEYMKPPKKKKKEKLCICSSK